MFHLAAFVCTLLLALLGIVVSLKPPKGWIWHSVWICAFLIISGVATYADYQEYRDAKGEGRGLTEGINTNNQKIDQVQTELNQVLHEKGKLSTLDIITKKEKTIISFLSKNQQSSHEVGLSYVVGGLNSGLIAQEVYKILNKAGWEVSGGVGSDLGTPVFHGIVLVININNKHSFNAGALQKAFGLIGIKAEGVIDNHEPEKKVDIRVGGE
ncbi:MAG TPA: hypothetical protein VIJ93_00040 [bacterium]